MSGLLRNALKCPSGAAAVELALLLPVLLLLLGGGAEMSRYMLIQQKIEKLAFSVADVLTQYGSLDQSMIEDLLSVTNIIVDPHAFEELGVVVVSSVHKDEADQSQKVRWQCTGGGQIVRDSKVGDVHGPGLLPGQLLLDDRDNIVIAEVYYTFQPMFTGLFLEPFDIYKTAMFRPRLGALTSAPGC